MPSQITTPLRAGQVFEIGFPAFRPRITVRSERELTVAIVAGDNAGFSDTVDYEAVTLREGLVALSWRAHIGSTIVHVLDLESAQAYTAVTSAKGGFMRLRGRIEPAPAGGAVRAHGARYQVTDVSRSVAFYMTHSDSSWNISNCRRSRCSRSATSGS